MYFFPRFPKLFMLLLALSGLAVSPAMAVGLGELELKSRINQPFLAEVALHNAERLAPNELVVNLASVEDFERRGLEKYYFYNDFRFEVVHGPNARPLLRITSHQLIREPYLDFILEARWASGRVQREYTVLMDKPAPLE